jgi:hypothetical protein
MDSECGVDGLDRAVQQAFTRPIPKSAGAQMRYLVKQLHGTRAVADTLGTSQRTVERYVKDQIRRPRADLAQRLEDAVRACRQPRIREHARRQAEEAGTSEQQLRNIAAEGLGEAYFRDGGRRAHSLEAEFTDVEHLEFEL